LILGQMRAAFVFIRDVLMENAGLKVLGQVDDPELIKGGSHRHDLLKDLPARAISLHHLLDPGDLAGDTCQPLSAIVS
jgi:hypothetical protein